MEATAITKYLRISPRKLRLVLDAVRHKNAHQAVSILTNLKKKGAKMTLKTLKSALANAKQKKMDEDRLYVSEIFANGGPSMKRYMSRSMGRADVILKRISHLTIVIAEREVKKTVSSHGVSEDEGKKKLFKSEKANKAKKAVGAGKS